MARKLSDHDGPACICTASRSGRSTSVQLGQEQRSRPMASAHQAPGSIDFSCVYAHPLPHHVRTGSSVLAAAHCSSSRAPLAGLAPHSRILQRVVLCYAVLCCALDLRAKRRCLQASSPLVAHPFSADSPPWATIISAGPERTINPPLAPAKRLVPIFHEVGARQPARRQERQSDFISRSIFLLCCFVWERLH